MCIQMQANYPFIAPISSEETSIKEEEKTPPNFTELSFSIFFILFLEL